MNIAKKLLFASLICLSTTVLAYDIKFIDPQAPNKISQIKVSCKVIDENDQFSNCPPDFLQELRDDGTVNIIVGKRVNTGRLAPVEPSSEKSNKPPMGIINNANEYYAFYFYFGGFNDIAGYCQSETGLNDQRKPTDLIMYHLKTENGGLELKYCRLKHIE